MDIEATREYYLSRKTTTGDTPFGKNIFIIRVTGKMFLCINLNTPDRVIMKYDPECALELRERYNAIEGAWHFDEKYWDRVFLDGDTDGRLVKHLMDRSYEKVIEKFAKGMRNEYEALP